MQPQPSLDITAGVQVIAVSDLATSPSLALSDDECVQKLAVLIEHKDETRLDEIVALIGRLALPIEWP